MFLLAALLLTTSIRGKTTSLGEEPDWSLLARYDSCQRVDEAMEALLGLYVPHAESEPWFTRQETILGVLKSFSEDADARAWQPVQLAQTLRTPPPRYWRVRASIASDSRPDAPLAGLHLALDPGHIGGGYAQLEQRWFRIDENDLPVAEGDMTLLLAYKLKARLEKKGARVSLVRENNEPLTSKRAEDFLPLARKLLADEDSLLAGTAVEQPSSYRVQALARMLFYRVSEIRARAKRVNEVLQPDMVLALHFNAAPWSEANQQQLSEENHLHVLVNGAYTADELACDDIRYELVERLMQGMHEEEIALGDTLARSLAKHTGLPPFTYAGENAVQVIDNNPYLWARNLLANRLYRCPVIYLEPYCMNNREVYERIQLGDYSGVKTVGKRTVPSIYEEYAAAVELALLSYYADMQ